MKPGSICAILNLAGIAGPDCGAVSVLQGSGRGQGKERRKRGDMGEKKIAAVICNYNKSSYVLDCIQSVLESRFRDFDLIVVDNASEDGSAGLIRERYGSQVKLFENKENLGGSGGFNTGIRYALEEGYGYVWCLDNDVLVDEHAIGELYGFMESHPEVGMCGSKVYHMEAPDYVQQFGIDIVWEEFCCEAKYCNRLEDGSMPEVVYSDAVAACSVLVRTSLIREIGALPEENFLYWDDTEWGLCCNRAGYKVASLGRSKALHSMGAKKETVNTFPLYYSWRNWIRFFMKYTPEENWETMCQSFLGGLFDVICDDLYAGEESRTKTVMRAYDDALHGRMGRAEEDIIQPIAHTEEKLKALLRGQGHIRIFADGREGQARAFAQRVQDAAREEGTELPVEICPGHALDERQGGKGRLPGQGADARALTFTMTEDVFRLEPRELGFATCFADREGRIVSSEEDVFFLLGVRQSRRMFLHSQTGLFLSAVRKLRSSIPGTGEGKADGKAGNCRPSNF